MTKRRVIELRAELGVAQIELATQASLKQSTISKVENERPVKVATALRVFYALNRLRKARELPELAFDDIAWNLIE